MANVMLRFDMRQPEITTVSQADLYQAAIEMCAWGDGNGIGSVHLSEHHGYREEEFSAVGKNLGVRKK